MSNQHDFFIEIDEIRNHIRTFNTYLQQSVTESVTESVNNNIDNLSLIHI